MTLPIERIHAINNTRAFLRKLIDPKQTPRIPLAIRTEARWMLKHYPWEMDMDVVCKDCKCGIFKEWKNSNAR